MIIQGKVIEVEWDVNIEKNGGGSYVGTTLTFKDSKGKVETKAWAQKSLNHPANGHVKASLQTLHPGSCFEAEAVKNDAGYWNWTQLKIIDNMGTAAQSTTNTQQTGTRSTYETPEERAERRALDKEKFAFEKDKQKLIIRQSSLSNAVTYVLNCGTDDNHVAAVLQVAKQFEAYVLEN